MEARVRQTTYDVVSDGVKIDAPRANKVSELVVAETIEQMIIDGRVFIASNPVREAADLMGNGAFSDVEPAFACDVPNGTSIKPLEFMFKQGGTVATAAFTALITVDVAVRITSGFACTPRNLRISATQPRTSQCTLKTHKEGTTNLLVGANTEDNTLWGGILPNDLDGLEGAHLLYSHKQHLTPWLIGPASFLVYIYTATNLPQGFWHFIYAEKPTSFLIDG